MSIESSTKLDCRSELGTRVLVTDMSVANGYTIDIEHWNTYMDVRLYTRTWHSNISKNGDGPGAGMGRGSCGHDMI